MDGKHETVKGIKTIVRKNSILWIRYYLKVDLQSLRMATTLRKYVASQFKPSIAKAFYDYFGSVNVLDFSAVGVIGLGFIVERLQNHSLGLTPTPQIIQTIKDKLSFIKNIKHSLKKKRM